MAVRGVNWVGDAVMAVPALRDLRRLIPHARMTLVTRAWARDIFAGAGFVDELLIEDGEAGTPPSFRQLVREWRKRRFDLAVLLPNSFAPALVAAAARVPLRVGYAIQNRGWLLTHPLAAPDWRGERHEVFYYRQIVAELARLMHAGAVGSEADELDYQLSVSPARREDALSMLGRRGVEMARPLVALCPGSTNSRAKRWPAESYATLADRLTEQAGAQVILIGSDKELDVTREVVRRMRRRPFVLTGETTLAETVAVLSVVDLLVTNDTGPAHVAAALGRPTLVIFGPTNPQTTRPFSPTAEIVRRPPDCAPCMLRDCPIDHRCMTAITPEEVCARALALLGRQIGTIRLGAGR